MWTVLNDCHSGGGTKEAFEKCYIEAPEAEAALIFFNRFGHNPYRVSCTCCGPDYSLTEYETLEEAARNPWIGYDAIEDGDCSALIERWDNEPTLTIASKDIKPEERLGSLPKQGYVWIE